MADFQYMTWNEDWSLNDDMNNYTATGWLVGAGGAVTQQSGYVRIDNSAGDDFLYRNESSKTLPYTFDFEVVASGGSNVFRAGDGSQRIEVNLPSTAGVKKYYRLIVRAHDSNPGSVEFYENGKLIKRQADTVASTTNHFVGFQATAASGEYIEVHHYKQKFGEDFGEPLTDRMMDTFYLDGRAGYELLFNRSGVDLPPIEHVEDEIPFQPGSLYRLTKILPRTVSLGLLIKGTSASDLNDKKRNLRKHLMQMGRLFSKMSDGYRFLTCRYAYGMEGEEKPDTQGQTWAKSVLGFRCFDPFWYSTKKTRSLFIRSGIDRLELYNFSYLAEQETYPEFYIFGPGLNPKVTNQTTGKSFKININLPTTNDYVYVNTKPGKQEIRDKNGNLIWGSLDAAINQFFPLVPGRNDIEIQYNIGTTDTTTRAHMYYRDAFLGV